MATPRKILYSPGFSAGWVTWCEGPREMREYVLTYQPIIDFLEAGGKFSERETRHDLPELHPLLAQLLKECATRWPGQYMHLGGARDLKVAKTYGLVRLSEHEGSEEVSFLFDDHTY